MTETKKKSEQNALSRLFLRRPPVFLEFLRKPFEPPGRLVDPYVKQGQVVVDLACAWGYYTFPIAERVGPKGRVIAVDLGEKCIAYIQKKAARKGMKHLEAHAASAADLKFVKNRSVDLVFANGLLCSMPYDRPQAVSEMKRVLKPTGRAYISLGGKPPFGLVDEAEWKRILKGFKVVEGGSFEGQYALVALK